MNGQIGGDTVEKAVGGPVAALEKAIESKDRGSCAGIQVRLTAGCNSCHRTLDHAFISIQRPSSQPYSNQSFRTARNSWPRQRAAVFAVTTWVAHFRADSF